MTYSSPGTPDSSVGSPVSPEGVILDSNSNSNDQDHFESLGQNLDNQDLQALMAELEQAAIQESTIQADGFHQAQHQDQRGIETVDLPFISDAAANDLLSTLLTNNEIFVTENDQVFHQMQNMQTENDQTENHQSENDQVFHQRQNMQ